MTDTLITTPFGFDSTAAEVVDGIDLHRQARDRHRRRRPASASRPPARWPARAPR